MKFVKHLALMAMVAVAAIANTACEEPEEEGKNPNLNHSLTLTVDVENITATSAKVKVAHEGKTADSWYGLLTTDTTTRIDELVVSTVEELKKGDIGSQLIFSKNYVKIFSPLTPATNYRYIAFGLSEEGEIYGEYASIDFTTLAQGSGNTGGSGDSGEDEVYGTMIVNPAWSIAFTGAGTIDGESYNNIVTVTSTDNNPYTIAVVYASEYDVAYLPQLGEYLLEDLYSYLESYNSAYGTEYVLNDMLYRGNGMTAFDELDPGYYMAIALGITSNGEISGLYAVSSVFEIEEEVPTSIYNGWIGDWVINGDNDRSCNVVIARRFANRSFNLMGFMGLPFSIVGEYSADRNDIVFYAQIVEPNYTFDDGTMANICLVGVDQDGRTYGLAENGEYGIAIAGVLEGGQRAIVRYGVNQPEYPKFNAMMLVADVNGKYYSVGNLEKWPAFNVMATIDAPSTTEEAQAVAPMKYVGRMKTLSAPSARLRLGEEIEVVKF